MKTIVIDNDTYEVTQNAKGGPIQLSRYNESTGVHISLHFSTSKNPAMIEDIQKSLKDMSLASILSLTDKV